MKAFRSISELILFFLFLNLTNGYSQSIEGKWKRDDGSIYNFTKDEAVLTSVGYHLQEGKFHEGEVKIKDIFTDEGEIYGFSKIKDRSGNTKTWKKIKLSREGDNIIYIRNHKGEK